MTTEPQPVTGYLQVDGLSKPYRVSWTGPWPPPEEMLLVVAPHAGFTWSKDPDPDKLAEAVAHGFVVLALQRDPQRTSTLPDDMVGPGKHVIRVAVYTVRIDRPSEEEPWTPGS